jgi:Protein of unknown function (DUF2798)
MCYPPSTISFPKEDHMQLTRVPARYAGILMPFILSIIMTMVVSAVATVKNLGIGPDFVSDWLSAWAMSWVIAFPTLLMALPLTRRLVRLVVQPT